MRDHPLKPGLEVEARACDGPHMGGWHPATILEVETFNVPAVLCLWCCCLVIQIAKR